MQCLVCSESYSDDKVPTVIICGHTFCNTCIGRINNGPRHERRCPVCRWNFYVTKPNYQMIELINQRNYVKDLLIRNSQNMRAEITRLNNQVRSTGMQNMEVQSFLKRSHDDCISAAVATRSIIQAMEDVDSAKRQRT